MNAKNTVRTVVAAILAVSVGMSGSALAGDRHHGGPGYSGGHGYKHHRGHGGYGRHHGYKRHRGHYRHHGRHGYRGHGHKYGRYYGHRGYPYVYYYDDDDNDLLLGLLLGGFAGYALHPGYRY